MSEEYSVGYNEGYQTGRNEAIDELEQENCLLRARNTRLEAQPAPVGYWLIGTDHVEFDKHEYHNGPEWEAIYTTPPAAKQQWVGLSDEQKLSLEIQGGKSDVMLAELVEGWLKEKNL